MPDSPRPRRHLPGRGPLGGTLAEGMTIGLIVSVAVIAGWDALPVPDPSRHSQLLVLGAAVILGAAVAGIWRVAAVRREAAEPEDSREEART